MTKGVVKCIDTVETFLQENLNMPKESFKIFGEYVFRSQKWWTFFRSQIFFSQSKFFFAVKTFFRSQSLFSQSEFIFAVKFDSDNGKIWLRKNDEELPIKIRSQKLSFFRSHPVHHSKIINVITNQDNTELYNRLKIELEYLRNC